MDGRKESGASRRRSRRVAKREYLLRTHRHIAQFDGKKKKISRSTLLVGAVESSTRRAEKRNVAGCLVVSCLVGWSGSNWSTIQVPGTARFVESWLATDE